MRFQFKSVIPILAGIIALFIPLVRDFHIESAMIAATVGAFWGGIAAIQNNTAQKGDVHCALGILGKLYLAGFPLLVYALITGCYTVHGLGFWLFFPIPSVFFGYGLGRLAREFKISYSKTATVLALLVIAIGGLLFEFLNLPQLYFFNHIWGGWPGPIYDETIRFSYPVIGFRFITFCWILVLWLTPHLNEGGINRWIAGLAAFALIISYTHLERMEIISPDSYLQQQLGGYYETENVRIYFDMDYYSDEEIDQLSKEFEFYIHQIKNTLQVAKPDSTHKIESYLYAHPWQKKQLVGAKYTSYVTVWKETPQIHIAKEQIDGSLKHEVVHAVTSLLDHPGFFLLPNIGLTEGIAVALDPDRSSKSTIDQLVAAQKPWPGPDEMQAALSYWGFYTGRSAVSYTTTGSFVRYLIEQYPSEYFMRAYEAGNFEGVYPGSFGEVVQGWHQKLDSVAVDTADLRRASEIFGRLSIFEQRCPHKVSGTAELFDRFLLSVVQKDTAKAIARLAELKKLDPEDPVPTVLWLSWNLRADNIATVVKQANLADTLIDAQLFYADAFQLKDEPQKAVEHLYRAFELAAQKKDTTYDEPFAVRVNPLQWDYDLRVRYRNGLLEPASFNHAYYLIKMRSVRNALERRDPVSLNEYAGQLHDLPVSLEYFSLYLEIIHRLAFYLDFELAEAWIRKLSEEKLNLRFQERLQQQKEWLFWLKGQQ